MKRLAPLIAAALVACSGGGGGDGGTGPTSVSSVTVAASSASIAVGQQVTLTFAAFNASGAALTGKTATWTTSSSAVASVSNAGVVTGVAAGTATITATVEGRSGTSVITVTSTQTACTGQTPLALTVGEVRILSGAERSAICLGGTAATEYMLLAFNNSLDTTGRTLNASFTASGTTQSTGQPAAALSKSLAGPLAAPTLASQRVRATSGTEFDRRLRERERRELGPRLRGTNRAAAYQQLRSRAITRVPQGGAAIRGVVGVPAVGTLITLNTNSNNACTNPQSNTGRVKAVTNSAIIIADTAAPAGGFSDAEYESFGFSFDTLVFAVDTIAFGAPSDMDGNNRVVIFFTQAVNQLTPATTSSVVGGFFFARDLFPVAGNQQLGLQACATSNEAEMFYVPVLDPNSQFNPWFRNKAALTTDLLGTLAHEFQHLINGGRRAWINSADDFEAVWLNEALSHIAEELLYYRVSRLSPRADLNLQAVTASAELTAAINNFQLDNFLRLSEYLRSPETGSPYKDDDDLPTRGAGWQFIRYAVDRSSTPENTLFRALVNARTNGMTNLSAVLAGSFTGGMTTAFRSWAVAQFLDNTGLSTDANFAMGSWNFRSILTNQLGNTGFPLKPRPMLDGGTQSFTLLPGGAGYLRFRVNAGAQGTVIPTSLPAAVDLVLVRTQ